MIPRNVARDNQAIDTPTLRGQRSILVCRKERSRIPRTSPHRPELVVRGVRPIQVLQAAQVELELGQFRARKVLK